LASAYPEAMTGQDVRWIQRFDNFQRALLVLERGVRLAAERDLSELEQQGLIQGFECTHELAWNLLKDYLNHQGITAIVGSRDATRLAFQNGLISDGETWMEMIRSRNQSSHTYNLEQARAIARDVSDRFFPAFRTLSEHFAALATSSE
jgi:nucleotidyltransferase substrate binding protein (TIGR01987 family)